MRQILMPDSISYAGFLCIVIRRVPSLSDYAWKRLYAVRAAARTAESKRCSRGSNRFEPARGPGGGGAR